MLLKRAWNRVAGGKGFTSADVQAVHFEVVLRSRPGFETELPLKQDVVLAVAPVRMRKNIVPNLLIILATGLTSHNRGPRTSAPATDDDEVTRGDALDGALVANQ